MLFVLLRDLLGNVMETVEASKVDRLPVRGSASKVLEDVAVPEGYVPGSFLQKFIDGNLAEAVAMDAAPASSADASTAGGASADASEAADVASADGPKAADAAHEGGGGGSELPAPPPPPPHIPPPPPPPPVPTAAVKIKVKAMPRPRPAHPKGQPPPKHVDVVTVDDESCSSPSSSWKTPAQHDADGSWQTWQHGWKTPAAMMQHNADGSWQTSWQHGDASDGQTAWHADGANWHASMSQTVESDGWSAILGCILCIFKFLPLYIFYTAVI
ncbi:unnamed protein product [Cladocopium goreaui]|uniref:Uncharacterized protein n=1 Tax=Cladocopium goreaui TaxID=2562237 RepID=A0A9P1CCI6_9DINO|nr:unnamed protein product [Cladocopium goreaui]